ncbi:hypothetical protein ACFQ60_42845 [Streptomyces zhihengii]
MAHHHKPNRDVGSDPLHGHGRGCPGGPTRRSWSGGRCGTGARPG